VSDEPWFVPSPEAAAGSAMAAFMRFAAGRLGRPITGYSGLHAIALQEPAAFWPLLLEFSGLLVEGDPAPAIAGTGVEHARFFPGLSLSYAENLLRADLTGGDDAIVVVATDETGAREEVRRGELRRRVLGLAAHFRGIGLRPGDRVVAIARNTAESVVACLATAAVGAAWSSVAPDLAADAVRDRFLPLAPRLLLFHGAHPYQGARRDLGERVATISRGLPTLERAIALDLEPGPALPVPVTRLGDIPPVTDAGAIAWERFPFNHPLFVLFSSGTTGAPKCIVHGAGGTLMEHWKELRLHSDLGPGDRLYFTTSCGWMMWNWQLGCLATGATLVLYDGSPSYPEPDALWRMIAREGVTAFGTSPAYLQYCRDAGLEPRAAHDLSRLRMMLSTGSILYEHQYDWVREHVGSLPLQSISGGTDIIGCFVLGNPLLPVRRGASQSVSLGYDVRVMTDAGPRREGTGELVCVAPFPSRPLGLFGDADGARFHAAYFAQHEGCWTHGDFLRLEPDGSARVLGRSDGTLNIRGIRIGPAEIYGILHHVPEVVEAMAVEQRWPAEIGGSRMVLLVVLREGLRLDRPLILRIKRELSQRGSPAHVPAVVAQVSQLPMTLNGKRSERAATDQLNGDPVRNRAALRNPESLDELAAHPDLRRAVQP